MAWIFDSGGRAADVLAELQAIDPQSLPDAPARAARQFLINGLGQVGPGLGVLVKANVDPMVLMVSVRRQRLGDYAP